MATVTKTFAFLSNAESFVATAGPASTLSWDGTTGNPAGSLKARTAGRNKIDSNYWEWTGTWEQLGVPTGSVVTGIQLSSTSTRCSEYNVGAGSSIGPYELRNGDGTVLRGTLWSGRSVSASSGTWTVTGTQAAVTFAAEASTTQVRIRLADQLNTGNNNGAAISVHDDQVVLIITYAAAPPAHSGSVGTSGAGTLSASGTGEESGGGGGEPTNLLAAFDPSFADGLNPNFTTPSCDEVWESDGGIDGDHYTTLVATSTSNFSMNTNWVPYTPGSPVSVGVGLRHKAGTARSCRADIQFGDVGGAVLSSVNGGAVVPGSSWQTLANLNQSHATAVQVRIRFIALTPQVGDSVGVDAFQIEPSATLPAFNPVEGAAGGAVALESAWIGAFGTDTMSIVTKLVDGGTDDVVIRYSTNSDMTSSTDSAVKSPDPQGVTKHTLTGLTADTVYHYRVVSGGVELADAGTFRTMPAAGSFTFGYASCKNTTQDTLVFNDLATRDPGARFFLNIGDLHYLDIDAADAPARRDAYETFLTKTNINAALRDLPMDYVWDDHDSTGNGAWSGDGDFPSAHLVYRERVPHFALPESDSIHHTFVVGRCRFIVMDCRSHADLPGAADSSSKTRLGATQKAWLINLLQTSTEKVVFLVSTSPWVAGVGVDDTWGSYSFERAEIAAEIAANGRVVILSGDQHCLALDDGTNSPGGCPVWHAAALQRIATFKGGPYSHGQSLGGPDQYGYVEVDDTGGSDVTVTYNGIQGDGSTWLTWSKTLSDTQAFSGGAAVGGSGTLSAGGMPAWNVAAGLSGSGALGTTGRPSFQRPVGLSGAGTLSNGGAPSFTRTLSLTGAGTLAAGGTAVSQSAGSVGLAGSGALTASGMPHASRPVGLTGTGALAAAGESSATGLLSLAGAGTLNGSGAGVSQGSGAASLAGSGALSATGEFATAGAASLSGAGTLASSGGLSVARTVQLVGAGDLTAQGATVSTSTVGLNGSGDLNASGVAGSAAGVGFSGHGVLAPASVAGLAAGAYLAGLGTLSAFGVPAISQVGQLAGDGTLDASGGILIAGIGPMSGAGVLTIVGVTDVLMVEAEGLPAGTDRAGGGATLLREGQTGLALRSAAWLV